MSARASSWRVCASSRRTRGARPASSGRTRAPPWPAGAPRLAAASWRAGGRGRGPPRFGAGGPGVDRPALLRRSGKVFHRETARFRRPALRFGLWHASRVRRTVALPPKHSLSPPGSPRRAFSSALPAGRGPSRPRPRADPARDQVMSMRRVNIAAANSTAAPAVMMLVIRMRRGSVEDPALMGSTIGTRATTCCWATMRARS